VSDAGTEAPEGNAAEPGFGEDGSGGEALPDLRDEPSFEEVLGAMEDAVGESSSGQNGNSSAAGGGLPGDTQQGTGGGTGSSGEYGSPGTYAGSGPASGGGGPMTPAEQVAVLDGELEKSTGEFDSMILAEQTAQRRAAREQSSSGSAGEETDSASAGGYGGGGAANEGGMADAGGYSTGGGMGGASRGGGSIPRNTAKYPPPADIPDGNDDDVVARQLREAAMREPDPAVREKLWDEYRKYKGIDN
jgi:hypothetical protein